MSRKLKTPTRNLESTAGLQAAIALAGLLASLWINFHWYLLDLNLVPGDRGDTRLVIFTLEHWFRVFQGLEPFFRLQMFSPDPNALGYADGLLLFGFPYAAFRLAGMDYFSSYQVLLLLLTGVGYFGWMLVLRNALGFSAIVSAVGAVLLSSLNALQLQADIGKLSALNLVPILVLCLCAYMGAKERGSFKALLGLGAFSAGLGLLLFTSYYPGWLLLFSLIVMVVLALLAEAVFKGWRRTANALWSLLQTQKGHVAIAIGAFLLGMIPFIITYAPVVQAGASRGFDLVLEFSPRLKDIVNVGGSNIVWGPLLQQLGFEFGNREVQMGSPALVLLMAGLAALTLARRLRAAGWRRLPIRERVLLLLAGTAVVLVLLGVRVGDLSLWYAIYRFVPGASALRAVGRVLIMVDLILIVLAMWGLEQLRQSRTGHGWSRLQILMGALSIMLIMEQVNWTPFQLNKAEQLSVLDRYEKTEPGCRAFYVNNALQGAGPFGYYQLDAMMISMKLGMPTVNGYSGFEPHEAFTMIPSGPEYEYRILDWLLSRDASSGICELDLRDGSFRLVEVAEERGQAQTAFRRELLSSFSSLFDAATRFLGDGNILANLHPQYLVENGYLDAGFTGEPGVRYHWIADRYWLGERSCGNKQCFGIGVVSAFADVEPILELYGPLARGVFFPAPEALDRGATPSGDAVGELLLVFPVITPTD